MDDRRRTLLDALLACALAALSIGLVLGLTQGPGRRAVHVGLVLAHVLPLALRRRAPLLVLGTMVGTGAASVAVGAPAVVLGPGMLISLYTVAACSPAATSKRATVGAAAVMAPVVVANGVDASTVVTNALAFAVAWWLGDRSRRATAETDVQRALAAHAADRAAAEERVRIARELHDVVAHAMSVIAVQAGTGRYVIDESPDVAKEALAAIERASREALQEMRRLLSVLRGADDRDIGLLPAPGLADVGTLVAASTDAGLRVHLDVRGEPVALPAGADLCAFRIVQEALTNVRRHSGARRAWVTVSWSSDAVAVEVADDGNGLDGADRVGHGLDTSGDVGHGLAGMRERAALCGGTLDIGLRAGGGCSVRACIPLGVPA